MKGSPAVVSARRPRFMYAGADMQTRSMIEIRRVPARFVQLMVTLMLCTACGGGSGGGAPSSVTGSARVTVTDILGDPVPAARVELSVLDGPSYRQIETFADGDGIARFSNVASRGPVNAYAWDDKQMFGTFGVSEQVMLIANSEIALKVSIEPQSYPLFGVASASVERDGVAENGRSLAFSIGLLNGEENDSMRYHLNPCTPDPENDASAYPADCVAGGTSSVDAPYEVPSPNTPVAQTAVANGSIGPFAVAVLLDQSSHIAANDPYDARVFALKYFLTTLGANDRVVLAAFASDDAASGQLAALPDTPVVIFPVGNPQFSAFNRDLFPTLDSLPTLEGGASPVYAAIDTVLDFTAAHASPDTRRAIVVLTDGDDETCGSRMECAHARQVLIDKSRATGIKIITIGLASPPGAASREALTAFTNGGVGMAFWIDNPNLLAGAATSLRSVLDGSTQFLETYFRIESPVEGAFQSGRTVRGTVHRECDWGDCGGTIYFSVPIP